MEGFIVRLSTLSAFAGAGFSGALGQLEAKNIHCTEKFIRLRRSGRAMTMVPMISAAPAV